jgi:hypothetical protein
MATSIPDLWPDDLKVDVVPPVAVLRAQEGLLSRKRQGMLQARVSTVETERMVQHQLDVIAPGLGFYRQTVLSATHDRVMLYPVVVAADALAPRSSEAPQPLFAGGVVEGQALNQREAASGEEFIRVVREVLQSDAVRALLSSLLARINAKVEHEATT